MVNAQDCSLEYLNHAKSILNDENVVSLTNPHSLISKCVNYEALDLMHAYFWAKLAKICGSQEADLLLRNIYVLMVGTAIELHMLAERGWRCIDPRHRQNCGMGFSSTMRPGDNEFLNYLQLLEANVNSFIERGELEQPVMYSMRTYIHSNGGPILDIGDGYGDSVDDPIKLEKDQYGWYVEQEYEVVSSCANIGNHEWVLIEQMLLNHHGKEIDQLKIQARYCGRDTGPEISYFFELF